MRLTDIGGTLGGVAARVLRTAAAARGAALRIAATRGRSMILLYHRVTPDHAATHHVVPAVSPPLFEAQLAALGEVGEIVPLTSLLARPARGHRVRIAITFDDDDAGHVAHALPVLRALGVPATFFLSGRALHGLGPYWWVLLEQAVAEHGAAEVGRRLGVPGTSAAALAAAVEARALAGRTEAIATPHGAAAMTGADVRVLADAGMTIGFHTVEHPVLTALADAALDRALRYGRTALAAAAGRPVTLLAYPHGRSDRRVAAHARAAGFLAACRTARRPVDAASDPFLLTRWEPGPLAPDTLLAHLALRLNYPPAAPPR